MAKLLLFSTVLGLIAIPVLAARLSGSRRGLQWTLISLVLFNLFYLFAVRFIYPRL